MFKTLHSVRVKFKHDAVNKITEAIIDVPNVETLIGGRARCSANDSFCKETGRRISLLRAMQDAKLSKNQRVLEWEQYRIMTKIPRWPNPCTLKLRK